MTNQTTKEISAKYFFSLLGTRDTPQLALNGEIVSVNTLKMAGFSLTKSSQNGGNGERCGKCSPMEPVRIWYKTFISCNNVKGYVWICSKCSKVNIHKRGGKEVWAELTKCWVTDDNNVSDSNKPDFVSLYLPSEEDFESAYRMLTRLGEAISIDTVLDKIEVHAVKMGLSLKSNWRMITEKNIEIWAKKM